MSAEVSPLLWYLFWAACVVLTIGALSFGSLLRHRQRMKALEILRSYAERGGEPPQAMIDALMKQVSEPDQRGAPPASARGALLQGFIGFLFAACIAGAIAWWRLDAGGPRVAVYAACACALFFGVGAFGQLIAALVSSQK